MCTFPNQNADPFKLQNLLHILMVFLILFSVLLLLTRITLSTWSWELIDLVQTANTYRKRVFLPTSFFQWFLLLKQYDQKNDTLHRVLLWWYVSLVLHVLLCYNTVIKHNIHIEFYTNYKKSIQKNNCHTQSLL